MSGKAGGESQSETRTSWFSSTSKKTQIKITVTFVVPQMTKNSFYITVLKSLPHGLPFVKKKSLFIFVFSGAEQSQQRGAGQGGVEVRDGFKTAVITAKESWSVDALKH